MLQKRDIKIIISADCHGRLEQLIAKVNLLQQKNNFDFMLLIGNVCHPRSAPFVEALRTKKIKLELQLYFIDSSPLSQILHALHPNGFQMAQNFRYLGSSGIINIKEVQIAFFSYNKSQRDEPTFTQIDSFVQSCKDKSVDILLTNDWSKEVQSISEHKNVSVGNYVSKLVYQLNPHYHVAAGGDQFYRMSPYRNDIGGQSHFISVGSFQQQPKGKYLYGLSVKPNFIELAPSDNQNLLQNPYIKELIQKQKTGFQGTTISAKNRLVNSSKQQKKNISLIDSQTIIFFQGFPEWARNQDIRQFLQKWGEIKHLQSFKDAKRGQRNGNVRFDSLNSTKQCLNDSGKFSYSNSRIKFQMKTLQNRKRNQDCWFCKDKGDRSLILYEGKYTYVSLQKGPLCRFHIQIIPYNHIQSTGRLDREESEEVEAIVNCLKSHFSEQGYQVITYERCLPLSEAINHCVVHFLPLKSSESFVKKFQKINKEDYLKFIESGTERRGFQHFLQIKIGDITFLKEIYKKEKVQADFMRQLLCQLLQQPRLVNWKICERTPEQLQQELAAGKEQLKRAGIRIE